MPSRSRPPHSTHHPGRRRPLGAGGANGTGLPRSEETDGDPDRGPGDPERGPERGPDGGPGGGPERGLPSGTRRIVHLDVDAFLASVEQALHPELRGKPLVIGGMPNERNLVMSSSYEARAFGVRPGVSLADAARLCPQAIFRRGDSQAANRLREETARVLRRFSPIVEVASIDDFFVDLTGTARLHGGARAAAERMRAAIRREVDLPVTVGVGTNRTLARLAGKLAKPGGVAEVLPGYEEAFLGPLPVEHLPGVGHRTRALLERFAIRTVGDLRRVSREVLFASFGRLGLVLFERARGRDPEPVEPSHVERSDGTLVPRAPAAIRRDSTFEPEEGRREIVEAMLAYVVERASARLRSHGHVCRSLEVRVRYVDTRPHADRDLAGAEESASAHRRRALPATDSTDALWRHARALFRGLPRRRALVKRLGVTLLELTPAAGWQRSLFDAPHASDPAPESPGEHAETRADRHRRLDALVDDLRARHGFGGILRGASLPLKETHPWTGDGIRLRTPSLNQ